MSWKTFCWKQWRPELAIVAIVGLLLAGLYAPFSYDEAFITFRYAANLSRGLGLVYNPGEPYLGTTGPGWAILLGSLHRLAPLLSVPQWAAVLSGLALLLIGIASYRLVQRLGFDSWWAAWTAIACMAHPLVIMPMGGEVIPVIALLLLAWERLLSLSGKEKQSASGSPDRMLIWTGFLGGLATWLRPDAIVAFGVLSMVAIIRRRSVPVGMFLVYGLVLLPWMWFANHYFGTPFPGTLATKTAQCKAGLWVCFLPGLLNWMRMGLMYQTQRLVTRLAPSMVIWVGPAVLLFGASVLTAMGIGLVRALRYSPIALAILLWPLLHGLGYVVLQAPFYPWYATPLGIAMGLSLGLATWELATHGAWGRRIALLLIALTVAGYGLWHLQHRLEDVPDPRESVHQRLAAWFRANVPLGHSLMGEEIGFLGYYLLDYRVYDVWGLVTPGLAGAIQRRDLAVGIQRYQPDYFIAYPADDAPDSFRAIPSKPWFQRVYRLVFRLDDTGLSYAPYIVIYERVNP
jgi:hypothetical protein